MSIRILILLFLGLVSASTSSLFAKLLPAVPAVSIAFWRMFFGAIILWGFTIFQRQDKIPADQRINIFLAGVFLGLHFACFFLGLKLTSVANAVVLATMGPFFTTLFERFVYKRTLSGKTLAGLTIAFLGVLVIQAGSGTFGGGSITGNAVALLSSFWIAMALILAEKIRKTSSTLSYSRTVYGIAALTLAVVALFTDTNLSINNSSDWLWLILLGLVPTILGHNLFYYAVKFVRPTIVAAVPLGEPVIASLMVWVFIGEKPGLIMVVGGAVIISGLYLLTGGRKKRKIQTDVIG